MSSTQEILFGHDDTPGIVAVEVQGTNARIFQRVDGELIQESDDFQPWFLTADRYELSGVTWTELDGSGYRFLAQFASQADYEEAKRFLRHHHLHSFSLPTPARQYLTISGKTLFKEMSYNDVVRMQLDLETGALRPQDPHGEILMIAFSDNRGLEHVISGDEETILRETAALINERDPDIIEGHNIYCFDLYYLSVRARMHGIDLSFGRDGSPVCFGKKRNCAIGYYSRPFIPATIFGRHVIDTLFSVQRYDVSRASLSSYGLKSVARELKIAEEDRDVIPHKEIAGEWKVNPERVKNYAIHDVRETRLLSEIVCPAEFFLTQMVPDTYFNAALSGNGEKINSIFIRHYLHNRRAIPEKKPPSGLPGGYTEVKTTGVMHKIVKCDVESLYPSIMLADKIKPKDDTLNAFLPALEELTKRRIAAKKLAKEKTGSEQAYWDGLQSAFKIIINSFYGYLAGPFNFNDYHAASKVTTTGQALVKKISEELEANGSKVIEIDTDGVYFQPPDEVNCYEEEVAYIEKIAKALPVGIRLVHDGRYAAMISLKIKNYILATYEGKTIFKGSSLRSRSDEPFGLSFISKATQILLEGEIEKAHELYISIAQRVLQGEMGVEEFARRERITEKTFTSTAKKRLAAAASESSVGEHVLVYQRNDGALTLASEYKNDEDRRYLLNKLYKFAHRLYEAFGSDFDRLFPKPSDIVRAEATGQATLNLFD